MIQTTIQPTAKKRDVQIAEIGINTQVWRSRTWDRLKFEVEYSRQKGTTSNSYLIQADKIALIDPPGQSFTNIYLEAIAHHEWRKLDYIILQHVNPNRLATIQVLAGYAPQATIICSKLAAKALKSALMFPEWKSRVRVVRDNDTLDLGQGHRLQFIRKRAKDTNPSTMPIFMRLSVIRGQRLPPCHSFLIRPGRCCTANTPTWSKLHR